MIMTQASECSVRELATPTIPPPHTDRRNLGSCAQCNAQCPGTPPSWCEMCFLRDCQHQNLRGLGSEDDDEEEEEEEGNGGSSRQPSHSQRFEPIGEFDWLTEYNMIRRELSSNCKPSFQPNIPNSCIENMFVTHTPACAFHEEVSGIFNTYTAQGERKESNCT